MKPSECIKSDLKAAVLAKNWAFTEELASHPDRAVAMNVAVFRDSVLEFLITPLTAEFVEEHGFDKIVHAINRKYINIMLMATG